MLNQVTLVGKITEDPELSELKNGRTFCNIRLEIKQSFKDPETDDYDTDFIDVDLWGYDAEKVVNSCGKGSVVAVRGRLKPDTATFWGTQIIKSISVVGDSVSFIKLETPKSGE